MTDRPYDIRRAKPGDAAALAAFAARVFTETFGPDNRPEDVRTYVASTYGPAQQAGELGDADVVTVLAECRGELVGYVQARRQRAPACVTGQSPIELWRFYVDGSWHGKGLAQDLMTHVHQAARELGGRTIWLGVDERNARAIAFYAKCGFRDVGAHPFWLGNDRQMDRVMVAPVVA